jgi:hypothetical protein
MIQSIIQDYLLYNSRNECPRNYHVWSLFAIMSAIVSRKVYINLAPEGEDAYFLVYPNLYVCLVGKQGNRKTTAKDIAYDIMREVAPEIPVSAESMSKEAITQFMAADEQLRTYEDPPGSGNIVEYRPMAVFSTELKNFLSINPITMIDFLTTIYDRKFYDVKTKNKGTDTLVNPYFVFLSCETPEWIIRNLKLSIISGGFSRRTVFVYETENRDRIPFPGVTSEGREALERVKAYLTKLKKVVGQFQWSPAARQFYSDWYVALKFPDDPIMYGYYQSKHIQLLKIAMLVALSANTEKLVLEKEHLELSLAFLDSIEANMPKLSEGVGRNELAHPTTKIIDMIEQAGGVLLEKQLQRIIFRDMSPQETQQVMNHLLATDQIKKLARKDDKGVERVYISTPAWYEDYKRTKEKEKQT